MSNRFNLPDITFCGKSASDIEADFLSHYETLTGISLTKADPRRIFAEAVISMITQQRVLIDQSAKQNLLAYSAGNNLENLGAFTDTDRLLADYANTTLMVMLSSVLTEDKVISVGTLATSGDGVFWALEEDLTIAAGMSSGSVKAKCEIAGIVGNEYAIGAINTFVTPIPGVASVSNTTISSGGLDVESDDAYADRIHEAPEGFSVAGPDGAYEYWAKTTSQSIIDVKARSPAPGVVEVRPLLTDGAMPDQKMLDDVFAVCSAKKVRPLTDNLTVMAPAQISYNIAMTYYINTLDSAMSSSIQAAVTQAVESYRLWQKVKLGRAIDPSQLVYLVKAAGAMRVVVSSPEYRAIESYQVAAEGTVTITYGGLE